MESQIYERIEDRWVKVWFGVEDSTNSQSNRLPKTVDLVTDHVLSPRIYKQLTYLLVYFFMYLLTCLM